MKWLVTLIVFLTTASFAQNQLGRVTDIQPVACPTGFASGSSCQHLTIQSCANTLDAGVTIGTKAPAGSKGTIVLFAGSNGTRPLGGGFASDYYKDGYTVIDTMWDAPGWESTGQTPNILEGACRPATLINYLSQTAKGAFCAQGHSAGSSALAYSMTEYGIDQLNHVELVSGPVMSDMEKGCETPDAPPITVVPTNGAPYINGPQYVNQFITTISHYTGQNCQTRTPTPQTANQSWLEQSIVQPGVSLSFRTGISGWLCDNGLNNSAAQGAIFYSGLRSPYSLTRISGCVGSEGVGGGITPQGVNGQIAVVQDMESSCKATKR
jgi:hypothetical protein